MDSILIFGLAAKDLLANGIFFAADVILITILVPIIITLIQENKWKKARLEIQTISLTYIYDLYFILHNYMNVFSTRMEIALDSVKSGKREYIMNSLIDPLSILHAETKEQIDAIELRYLKNMQLLMPAFNADIAIITANVQKETRDSYELIKNVMLVLYGHSVSPIFTDLSHIIQKNEIELSRKKYESCLKLTVKIFKSHRHKRTINDLLSNKLYEQYDRLNNLLNQINIPR